MSNWNLPLRFLILSCLLTALAPTLSWGQVVSDSFALGAPKEAKDDAYNLTSDFERAYDEYSDDDGDETTFQLMRRFLASSTFNVRTSAKTGTARRAPGVFVANDLSTIETTSDKAGYLYVFYQFADGTVRLLYPYDLVASDNHILKRTPKVVPSPGDKRRIKVAAPFGREYVFVLVTTNRLPSSAFDSLQLDESDGEITAEAFGEFLDDTTRLARGGKFEYGVGRARVDTFESAMQAKEFTEENRVFFVGVGINVYADRTIARLGACVSDTELLSRSLEKYGALEPNRAVLISDKGATKERINFLFDSVLPDETRPGDLVIVYWSGHGAASSRTSSRATLGKGEGYFHTDEGLEMRLVTYDSSALDGSTMLSPDRMNGWVDRLAGRQVLFILDCCYSGGAIDVNFPWRDIVRSRGLLGRPNIGVIAACEPEQTAGIKRNLGTGSRTSIMTLALVQLLDEYVADSEASETVVNVKELAEKLVKRVPQMRENAAQDPYCAFSYSEDLTITLKKPKR